jgi:NADP-dependent aldehyde dehydrogenase
MPELSGHNFIAGGRSAAGSVVLHSIDATTGQPLPTAFIQATVEEVDAAASAAAQASPIYRNLSAERRAQFLEAIAAELDALGDDFVALVGRNRVASGPYPGRTSPYQRSDAPVCPGVAAR